MKCLIVAVLRKDDSYALNRVRGYYHRLPHSSGFQYYCRSNSRSGLKPAMAFGIWQHADLSPAEAEL